MAILALAAVVLVPAAAASHTTAAPTPTATPSAGVWAWGALDNTTVTSEYLGAYASFLNLTGGNFSAAGAFIVAVESLHAEYASFTVVNATSPSPSTRSIEATAVGIAAYTGEVVVAGDLPAAGVYAPGAPVPLVNTTCYYLASIVEENAYVAFTNYTVSNTSIVLTNEHVEAFVALNTTTIAYSWPSVSTLANGSTAVNYTTEGFTELGWVGESVSLVLTPGLPIAELPLSVGKTWNATTHVAVTGWAAYATALAFVSPTKNGTSSSSGAVSLNASANATFDFAVVGSESIVYPNGTESTGYNVEVSQGGSSTSGFVLWDGLAVLPTSGPVPAASLKPTTPVDGAAPLSTVAGPSTQAVDASDGFPVAMNSPVGMGTTLATTPLPPSSAQSKISASGVPARPATPIPPTPSSTPASSNPTSTTPVSSTPPASSTPPSNGNGAVSTPTKTASHTTGLDPYLLVGLVAGIVAVFLAVELVRERRHK